MPNTPTSGTPSGSPRPPKLLGGAGGGALRAAAASPLVVFLCTLVATSALILSFSRSPRESLPWGRGGRGALESGHPCGVLQAGALHPGAPAGSGGGRATCPQEFLGYRPSAWEAEWAARAQQFQEQPELVCKTLISELNRTKAWLAVTARPGFSGGRLNAGVFSAFKYKDECTGQEYSAFIEPLVGHFRHPFLPWFCHPPGEPIFDLQDRSYLLLNGVTQQQFQRAYPGRRYLFDLGTAQYNSSLQWFVEHFEAKGVSFDEIWAWELFKQDPAQYWAMVPKRVQPALHFFNNNPVTVAGGAPNNPLNILRARWQPGDYVVFKLDIDNSALELELMAQIEGDPALISMISELMFEMHYFHPDMEAAFGKPDKRWIDVVELLTRLRNKGLRVHYWP